MLPTISACADSHAMRVRLSMHVPLLLLTLVTLSLQLRDSDEDAWNYLSLRYGEWYGPPLTASAAYKQHYNRKLSNCKTAKHVGFLYHRHGDTISMPIYDSNGRIAGIQSAIPGNMLGYNAQNQTIPLPPSEVKPPFLHGWTNSRGVPYYTLTVCAMMNAAYFKHPRLICNPTERRVRRGRGLYIQMGDDAEYNFVEIPLHARNLDPMWTRGTCMDRMGRHYFMNFSKHLPCEEIYPLFLLYDMQGELGAFGWSFQGSPPQPSRHKLSWFRLKLNIYPFIFGDNDLPACMYNEQFRMSGIHIWLKPDKQMTCGPTQKVPPQERHNSQDNPRTTAMMPPIASDITLLLNNKHSQNSKSKDKYKSISGRNHECCVHFHTSVILISLISVLCLSPLFSSLLSL